MNVLKYPEIKNKFFSVELAQRMAAWVDYYTPDIVHFGILHRDGSRTSWLCGHIDAVGQFFGPVARKKLIEGQVLLWDPDDKPVD